MESRAQQFYEERWLNMWQRLGAKGDVHVALDELLRRYTEPQRAYHNLIHLRHCFVEWEQVRHLAINPEAIEMALWFHDAIYNQHAGDNEEQSAALAISVIKEAGLEDVFAQLVSDLILATKHSSEPVELDARLLVDIDLAILGQSPEHFDEYERQIRCEYEWVSEEVFNAKRAEILQAFLNRPAIYSTSFFQHKYEQTARRNLERSLQRLRLVC